MIEAELAQKLKALPSLGKERAEVRSCKICQKAASLFDVVDFNKFCATDPYALGVADIPVRYYRCSACQFLFTDLIDNWTTQEIARFIYNDDYIKVDPEYVSQRSVRTARQFAIWLKGCEDVPILDYGSGSGKFADEMKGHGFLFVDSYDPFSHPERPKGVYDLITCFEVIEHSPAPMETLIDMASFLSESGAIIVGQTIQPTNIEEIGGRWWYLAPRNGHVSTFSDKTFFVMAEKVGLRYRRGGSGGGGVYVFARAEPGAAIRNFVEGVGPVVSIRTLFAPGVSETPTENWHNFEASGMGAFRWTAAAELVWPGCRLAAGVTTIEIPFFMEVHAGFAAASEIRVGGTVLPTTVGGRTITAVYQQDRSESHDIVLRTPAPVSPSQVRGSPDTRPLGLAILLG